MKNLGFIGYPLYAVTKDGRIFSEFTKKFLKLNIGSSGRYRVNLFNEDGPKLHYVHQVVAQAFLDNSNNLPVVNHLDGNPLNNNVFNLEWTTHEGNSLHAASTGLSKVRSLGIEEAHHVFSLMEDGYRNCDIADITGFPYAVIGKMRQGANYRDIWEEYDIPMKSRTLSLSKAERIISMLLDGKFTSDIVKELKVGRNVVKDIRDGRRFSNLYLSKKNEKCND